MTSLRSNALAALLLVLCASSAAAQAPAGRCARTDTNLEDDPAPVGQEVPTLTEVTNAKLREIAACWQNPEYARQCLYVQGQYDQSAADPTLLQLLGSERAARMQQAELRVEAVMNALTTMGAPMDSVVRVPPSPEATYAGVKLTFVRDCMPLVQRSKRPPPSAAAPTYEIDADASAAPPPEPQKDGAGTRLFGSLEGVGSAMATSPDNVLAGGARVGLGLAVPRWYAHLQVGLLVGSAREERTSTELVLSAGHAFGDSLHLGLAGGLRFASSELAKPWLDEAWFLGIGCAQRVIHFDGGAVWLDELFAPLGFRKRRAGFVGDTVVAGDRNDYAPRVDVGIVLQLDLLDLR